MEYTGRPRRGRWAINKIAPDHLARETVVYIRNSTHDQLLHNHESRRRHNGLPIARTGSRRPSPPTRRAVERSTDTNFRHRRKAIRHDISVFTTRCRRAHFCDGQMVRPGKGVRFPRSRRRLARHLLREAPLAAVGLDTLLAGATVACETAPGRRGPEVSRIHAVDFSTESPRTASFARTSGNRPITAGPGT